MGVITFNGRSSDEFGCTIEERPAHTRGSRRGELIEVPGRNGAMALEDGSYTTYTQSYVVAFKEGDATPPHRRAAQVAEWLLGSSGFCRLEDSFEPGFYRLARFSGPLNIGQVVNAYGRCTLEFECQPQRYLKTGEVRIGVKSYDYAATIQIYGIPGDVASVYVKSNGTAELVLRNDSGGRKEAEMQRDGDWSVGEVETAGGYNYAHLNVSMFSDETSSLSFKDADGNEMPVFSASEGHVQFTNPTSNAAGPLLEFRDQSTEPAPEPQTLTKVNNTFIGSNGEVLKTAWSSQEGMFTTQPVTVAGYDYAIITGGSYSFFDSSGNVVAFDLAGATEKKVIVPSGADTIVLGGSSDKDTILSLQNARPTPGAGAATIGSTTINLDFSDHDTIFLDCERHDAYYADGSNANSKISFADSLSQYPTFPQLGPGVTSLIPGDGFNLDFYITPRWWVL